MNGEQTKKLYRVTRVVWYIFYVIEAFLIFRFLLKLFAANAAAGFTAFIYGISGVLVAPFRYVFGTNAVGNVVFEWGTLLAMLVYWVVAWGVIRLIVMNREVPHFEAEESLERQDTK